MTPDKYVLAADIGGTKTLLQLVSASLRQTTVVSEHCYTNDEFNSFDSVLDHFLATVARDPVRIDSACFAVAGPLATDRRHARVTNLPWSLSVDELQEKYAIACVRLINDFEAVAHGVLTLPDSSLVTLQQGRHELADGNRLLVGAGTGLGAAQLYCHDGLNIILPSEFGHCDFAPADALQRDLLSYLAQRMEHVSWETVLSGPGLVNIYHFYRHQRPQDINPDLQQALSTRDDASVIYEFARQQDRLASHALSLFVAVYGSAVGNLALMTLPYAGIYIAGGIAPKILSSLRDPAFIQAMQRRSKMSELMEKFPVHVIMDAAVGLAGARQVALVTPA